MVILWQYPMQVSPEALFNEFTGPIVCKADWVYLVSGASSRATLHTIHTPGGKGRSIPLPCMKTAGEGDMPHSVLPEQYFALEAADRVLYYAGDLFSLQGGRIHQRLELITRGEISSHLMHRDRLYVILHTISRQTLCCINLSALHIEWETDITCEQGLFSAGPLSLMDGMLACFGRDRLLLLSPEDGRELHAFAVSRIGKLYSPIRAGEGELIVGWTNWSSSGVLRYQLSTGKVLWRHRRRMEGPELRSRIWLWQNRVYWVKNNRELICLDAVSGEELYHQSTDPWLYTDLCFHPHGLLYGTAGANGYIRFMDPLTGEMKWTAALQDGCEFFAIQDNTLFTGDKGGFLYQFDLSRCKLVKRSKLCFPLIGQYSVSDNRLYTVALRETDALLLCIAFSPE